jgi:hypothetical protein
VKRHEIYGVGIERVANNRFQTMVVAVEFSETADKPPDFFICGMEDMRAIFMDIAASTVIPSRVDISGDVVARLDDHTVATHISQGTGAGRTENACANNEDLHVLSVFRSLTTPSG